MKKNNRVAACLILGDEYREEELEALFESLKPHVHGIFIAFNGTKKTVKDIPLDGSIPFYADTFKWEDDFAKARQQSFDMVPKDKFEWMMWIDSDDIFHAPNGLQPMFDGLDEYSKGIFVRYDYAVDPDSGIVVVQQWRERFMATDAQWQWKFKLHEVCAGEPGTQFARSDVCWIEHVRKSGEDRGARDRNRRILARAIRENPEEPRYMFYFAGETMAEADSLPNGPEKLKTIDAAIHAFEKYKEMQPVVNDDYFLANTRISDLYRMKGDHRKAIDNDLNSIAIYPGWPDGYVGAAKSCMELGDYARMKAFADIATKLPKPDTVASVEPMMNGFYPYFLRALAEENLEEYDQALKDYKKAKTFWNPSGGFLNDKIKIINKRKRGESSDDIKLLRKSLRGTKPDKSICFYTSPIPEVWHPKTVEKEGSGGAEICVMELAKRFAADGWRTVVFGTPGENRGVYEGVEYWDSGDYLPSEPFKVFVSSRAPQTFEVDINAKLKLLWMHDVNVGEAMVPFKDRPDKIIALTKWHKNHLHKLYNIPLKNIEIINNGINVERFERDRTNEPVEGSRFIWSSSPDRGLDTLLSLWPHIRNYIPDAELHVFYGWNMIDKIIAATGSTGYSFLEIFKARIVNEMNRLGNEEAGIFNHGRINQQELAKEMYKSTYWGYPTTFMETFCITAIENQAAGVIPITSKLGALQETVAIKDLMIEGWPQNLDYQNRWLSLLLSVMELPDDNKASIRQKGREYALKYSWEAAFSQWNNLFNKML